ncbi:Zonular occludens toxin (Zot) [Aliarcobacter thereius]|uniref:zonular occludens toxin domain-containing protein n=1 Tax=Aliarcobacter thereius TaxID=544718 RepID=UPI000827D5EF|nr:zonular occludens toxin domain-containing protein [Aliarcobacter thereius]OCL86859.1 Zonular occludens toxin (Zot) [Aliarcobacter thereius]
MTTFLTGVPGGAKSYFGIFEICKYFSIDLNNNKKFKPHLSKSNKYKNCLTNINEIKLDKFENVSIFDFIEFKAILTVLHSMFKAGKTDTELLQYLEDNNIIFADTLIVLDECQNYLSKEDTVLIWWLSYHRHFHQDIILITQNLDLVNKKYFAFSEIYLKAIPPSKKIFNNSMIYHQFTSPKLYKNSQANTIKLPVVEELFTYYLSGANQQHKSFVVHYIKISIVIFIVLMVLFFLFIKSKNQDTESNKSDYSYDPAPKQKITPLKTKSFFDNSDLKLFVFNCFDDYCYFDSDSKIPKTLFDAVIQQIETKLISKREYNNSTDFYIITNKNNFEFIKKENLEDEKTSISNPIFK